MGTFLKSLLEENASHYDESNPRFRFLFNSTHCLVILKYILVVHVLSSVFGLFLCSCIASIVCPIAVYVYKHQILGHFGFHHASSHFVTLMLILNVMLVYLIFSGLLYWQWAVCLACREYFRKRREQSNYAQLSVPESFAIRSTIENQPFVDKKSPDYMVFSLDHVDLDSSNEDDNKSDIVVEGKPKTEKV
ncbi:hypothetical protein M3Y97_00704100 [Aphelenchoides bicaudatus]|nr:hypothetical protein M3Y97_00704100 [Aphelenchoides bicaudatus]